MIINEIVQDLATSKRLVVKNHHDYHFKERGKFYATITKKLCVFKDEDGKLTTLKGRGAKEMWEATRTACGHTLAGLV